MARNSQQLWAAIAKEEQTIASATSEMTRRYARERRSYLLGELMLQREHEARQAQGNATDRDSICPSCGKRRWLHAEMRANGEHCAGMVS